MDEYIAPINIDYLSLDIEGAEYKVLDKMFKDGSINYIDKLYIEWHWDKIGITEEKHNDSVKQLEDLNLNPIHWDAHRKIIDDIHTDKEKFEIKMEEFGDVDLGGMVREVNDK